MTVSEPRLRSLLRQAQKVATAGKRSAAEKLYRQIIDEAPESEAAWLGLAKVLSDSSESIAAYEKVLELNPDNQEAQTGLARLQGNSSKETAVKGQSTNGRQTPPEGALDGSEDSEERLVEASPAVPDQVAVPLTESEDGSPESHRHTAGQEQVDLDWSDGDAQATHELVCYRHPNRETALRCYTCDRPICSSCAVKTPVGYRCPTCVREAEDVFYTAKLTDYLLALLVSLPLSLLAGYLVVRFGGGGFFFIFIMLFIGGAVGGFIGRVTLSAVGRRRGRYLPHLVAAAVVMGVVIPALPILILLLMGNVGVLGALLIPGIYLFVATSAAFYQMK